MNFFNCFNLFIFKLVSEILRPKREYTCERNLLIRDKGTFYSFLVISTKNLIIQISRCPIYGRPNFNLTYLFSDKDLKLKE